MMKGQGWVNNIIFFREYHQPLVPSKLSCTRQFILVQLLSNAFWVLYLLAPGNAQIYAKFTHIQNQHLVQKSDFCMKSGSR